MCVSSCSQVLSVSFDCEKEDTAEVFGLLSEVVRSPLLPADKLSLFKGQVRNLLQHRYDSAGPVGRGELQKLIYGRDSIYARQATTAQVESISADDIKAFLAAWERPDSAVMGIVGDFKSQDMLALVEQQFGDWAPAPGQPAAPPVVARPPVPPQTGAGKVFLVDKPDVSQVRIQLVSTQQRHGVPYRVS